eukprot:gnl/Spiro4/238_TR142_c0_g1_i1.p1 gnl/Spiro4/238_TR142_c0_g1~~gnl/Spiro4/238_TR142_c0_g1_i1.p1  ORF type:complete len:315 (+),score=66.36 gnl/Spiro4/238_TR142_c0_g1_i1:27-971(+)
MRVWVLVLLVVVSAGVAVARRRRTEAVLDCSGLLTSARGPTGKDIQWGHNTLTPPLSPSSISKHTVLWKYVIKRKKRPMWFDKLTFGFKVVKYVAMDVSAEPEIEWRTVCRDTEPTPDCADIIYTRHISDCLGVGWFYMPGNAPPRFAMVHYLATGLSDLAKELDLLKINPQTKIDKNIDHNRKKMEKYLARSLGLRAASLSDFYVVLGSGSGDASDGALDVVEASSYSLSAVPQLLAMGFTCDQIASNERAVRSGPSVISTFAVWDDGEMFRYGRVRSETSGEMAVRMEQQEAELYQWGSKGKWELLKDEDLY